MSDAQRHKDEPPEISTTTVRFRSNGAAGYLAAAHGIPISPRTLDKLRSVGGGPAFQKFNRAVLYHRDALDTWALKKLSQPLGSTSELGEAQ
jgi:hypothetical protein